MFQKVFQNKKLHRFEIKINKLIVCRKLKLPVQQLDLHKLNGMQRQEE